MEDILGKVTLKTSLLTDSKLFSQKTASNNISSLLNKRKDCFSANAMNSAFRIRRKLVCFIK